MIAYNKQWLYNLYVRNKAEEAYRYGDITLMERDSILFKHPYLFYTPNIFVRVGLFLLTIIISNSSVGLFSLLFMSGNIATAIGILAIIVGAINYGVLEFFTQKKHHFNSGVDHALMLTTATGLVAGLNLLFNVSPITNAFISFLIASYFAVRFSDAFMSILAFCCFVCLTTLAVITHFPGLKYYLPFTLMAFSIASIIGIKKLRRRTYYGKYYNSSLLWLEIISGIGLYAFGNYYVIKEIGNSLLNAQANDSIVPFSFIFWILTIVMPLVYLGYGIVKRNILYIRLGLICIVAMAVTIRYYYNFLSAEIFLTLGGIFVTLVAWILIRFLKQPRSGFSSLKLFDTNELVNLESLIVIENFSQNSPSPDDPLFGGGSGGGGGASSHY
ncbi:MAG: hypothetical protein ABIR81_09890 [Ginsengibacter sp.]